MKILVVCQYYYPESFQINDICKELVQLGHNVTVLTGLPNYPTGVVSEEYRNGRKRHEQIDGVDVIRCFEIGRKKGIIGLVLNYFSYCISAWWKIGKLDNNFDLVFVYQLSPVLMAIPGIRYKNKYKKPLILYCCDLWPESMKLLIKNDKSIVFSVIKFISKRIYQNCDKILVQTKYFFPYFTSTHKIPHPRLQELAQFANDEYLDVDFNSDNGIVDFVFLGNIGIAQNLNVFIDAVERLRHIDNFMLHFVGDGSCLETLQNLVIKKNLQDKIKFYGCRPLSEMTNFYRIADVCLVSLNNDNLTGLTIPSKVQGYMAAGKMILGIIEGATQEIITKSQCGVCVAVNDIDGLTMAMNDIIITPRKYEHCGENGRSYFRKYFSRKQYIMTLEHVFKEMIK